mgnify:CR=1 FL=1|jgi:hypothetical protein|tara:strand:+ start:1740 stop:1946 length:207 start_codon:yes stop_codon:yes gene_type:complete
MTNVPYANQKGFEFDEKGMIKQLPFCAKDGCKKNAMIELQGVGWICGGCFQRVEEAKAKKNNVLLDSI